MHTGALITLVDTRYGELQETNHLESHEPSTYGDQTPVSSPVARFTDEGEEKRIRQLEHTRRSKMLNNNHDPHLFLKILKLYLPTAIVISIWIRTPEVKIGYSSNDGAAAVEAILGRS